MCYTSKAVGPKAHNKTQYTLTSSFFLVKFIEFIEPLLEILGVWEFVTDFLVVSIVAVVCF